MTSSPRPVTESNSTRSFSAQTDFASGHQTTTMHHPGFADTTSEFTSPTPSSTSPLSTQDPTMMVSSRLTRREQQKMLKQTFWLGLGAVVLFLLCLFVIVPGTIRFVGSLGQGQLSLEPEDTVPPQVPIISAPVAATNSATLSLSGFGEAESEFQLLNNGQAAEKVQIGGDGAFSIEISLQAGENSLSAYSIDKAGNESSTGPTYKVSFDSEVPTLEISEPADGSTIQLRKNQLTTIKGITEPRAKVEVNGRLVYANAEGAFTTSYQLNEGDNSIVFKAIDQAGNFTEKTIAVKFEL